MKKSLFLLICVLFALNAFLLLGCGDDDDDTTTDGDTADGDTADGDMTTDGDTADGDMTTDGDTTTDGDMTTDGDEGDAVTCDPNFDGSTGFGGKMKADCDTKVGVCENAVTVGTDEYYPCVDDPDCCCASDTPMMDDIYACEFDSCVDDGYCDDSCPAGIDPDC